MSTILKIKDIFCDPNPNSYSNRKSLSKLEFEHTEQPFLKKSLRNLDLLKISKMTCNS